MNAITKPFRFSGTPTAMNWRLTESMLIEEGPGLCRLYGRWDRTFGRWLDTADGLVPFQVNEPVLGRYGLWFEPEGRRDDDWYASRTAIAAYFSLIPLPIRRLVAPHGNRQWELLEAIWRDPALAGTLDI